MVVVVLPQIIFNIYLEKQNFNITDNQKLDSILAILDNKKTKYYDTSRYKLYKKYKSETENKIEIKFINFDPNIASKEELISIGFSEKTANIINNFRNKGGKFKIKNDLLKVYGIDAEHFKKIKKYILLPDTFINRKFENKKLFIAKSEIEAIDINLADSSSLEKVKGFGAKLTMRVLKFRDKLGGFISKEQFNLVFGLDSSQLSNLNKYTFISSSFKPRKIVLEGECYEMLKLHPFIGYKNAKILSNYIKTHGKIYSTAQLKSVYGIDEVEMNKMLPYLDIK